MALRLLAAVVLAFKKPFQTGLPPLLIVTNLDIAAQIKCPKQETFMEIIRAFITGYNLTGFVIRAGIILTILMAIYKSGEAVIGVFS